MRSGMAHVEIYTDDGCEPNPGPGGYGVVVLHPKKRAEINGGSPSTSPAGFWSCRGTAFRQSVPP